MTMVSSSTHDGQHAVFVYGTLKRGFTNYTRYLGVAETFGKASFIGNAKTVEHFPMVVRSPNPPVSSGAPLLMDVPGVGNHVLGEVFVVDDTTLAALDLLEGVNTGRYYKRQLDVHLLDNDSEVLYCTAYFAPACEELLELSTHPCYTTEHHDKYQPKALRADIRMLCRAQDRLYGSL
jgi:gamma-glutamylaminecyclotransferase